MRRKDREVTETSVIDSVFEKAQVCRLGLCTDQTPYIVPMNFGREGNQLYFHCAPEGRKLDMIRQNPLVCFELEADLELVTADKACGWTMRFTSIMGTGKARLLETAEEKRRGLDVIMSHYAGKGSFHYGDNMIAAVAVLMVEINEMTCKRLA